MLNNIAEKYMKQEWKELKEIKKPKNMARDINTLKIDRTTRQKISNDIQHCHQPTVSNQLL